MSHRMMYRICSLNQEHRVTSIMGNITCSHKLYMERMLTLLISIQLLWCLPKMSWSWSVWSLGNTKEVITLRREYCVSKEMDRNELVHSCLCYNRANFPIGKFYRFLSSFFVLLFSFDFVVKKHQTFAVLLVFFLLFFFSFLFYRNFFYFISPSSLYRKCDNVVSKLMILPKVRIIVSLFFVCVFVGNHHHSTSSENTILIIVHHPRLESSVYLYFC